jgi:tetratricopeptide (TPR) repeat protein
MEALAAFGSAEARLSGAQRRDARFGMALSYLKLNMTEEASRLAATTDLTRQQRIDTESIILNQRGVVAYQQGRYRKAIGYFDALEQVSGRLRRDLALLRGYAYLNSGNRTRAQEIFLDLHNQLATTESRRAMEAAAED